MPSYTIRLMHDDGSLAMIYVTACPSDDQARNTADDIVKDKSFERAEVWRDLECVHRIRSPYAVQ